MLNIGIVNNMPPAAVRSTERQFQEILTAASAGDIPLQIRWYRLMGVRPDHYGRLDDLWHDDLDGLIVTGAEPKADALTDEPFWEPLTRTVDWAARNTTSTIFSCLAAHAAVLHLDGIERCPNDEKVFGLFDSVRIQDHAIVADTDPVWRVPHSRWNGLPEPELAAHGYSVLARSEAAGVDTFVKQVDQSLFVFLQSHPEYEAQSLMREYHRDVVRFHNGLRDRYPNVPLNYFDSSVVAELEAMRDDPSGQERGRELLDQVQLKNDWRSVTVQLYRNWLGYLARHSSLAALDAA
jgi:homoserine O-succinyltransferase/O-acetyltransferase